MGTEDQRVLPGPGGSAEARARRRADSIHIDEDDIRNRRRIATIDGSDVKEGEPFFDLPKWFTRTGRTTCEIETGFGIVKLKTVAIQEDTLLNFAQGSPKACKAMLFGIRSIPDDWVAEEDVTLDKGFKVLEGDMVPDPQDVAVRTPAACAKYVAEFFPRSPITQIVTAYQFMVMPPIAYTEVDSD